LDVFQLRNQIIVVGPLSRHSPLQPHLFHTHLPRTHHLLAQPPYKASHRHKRDDSGNTNGKPAAVKFWELHTTPL
jgi:hypothetical protein